MFNGTRERERENSSAPRRLDAAARIQCVRSPSQASHATLVVPLSRYRCTSPPKCPPSCILPTPRTDVSQKAEISRRIMALYVRTLRRPSLPSLPSQHVIAIFLTASDAGEGDPGTLAIAVHATRKRREERGTLSLSPPPRRVSAPAECRARNSFSAFAPVAFPHADRKRRARRIPSPRFGTRRRNLFARRQVAYGAVLLISVRVSGRRVLSVSRSRYAPRRPSSIPAPFFPLLPPPAEPPLVSLDRWRFKRAGLSTGRVLRAAKVVNSLRRSTSNVLPANIPLANPPAIPPVMSNGSQSSVGRTGTASRTASAVDKCPS